MMKKAENKKYSIKIAGIGDCGINIINDFGKRNMSNVECLDINTEWAFKTANRFIKIGTKFTRGLGAGARVIVGKRAAEEDKEAVVEAIKACDLLIIIAGLGGGTGGGASPVITEMAKELKIPTIAFVITPPKFEGEIRGNNAEYGLENLKGIADILVVLSGERFLLNNPDWKQRPIIEYFNEMDKVLQRNILKVVDLFNSKIKNKSSQEILKDVNFDKTSYIDIFKKDNIF